MPDKICPLMSRPIMQGAAEENPSSITIFSKLEEVQSLGKRCAMWVDEGPGYCGYVGAQ